MEFIRIPRVEDGAAPLLDRLLEELEAGKSVVWIVTGGSNIPLSVHAMDQIPEEVTANLTVCLTDERFGEYGHKDSNARQLRDAGFAVKLATMIEVLEPGFSFEDAIEKYELAVSTAFDAVDIVIAQIGMGPDGHILGVLPNSPVIDSDRVVAGYESNPYTRITLTLHALTQYVSAAYVFCFGSERRPALENLLAKDLPPAEQPAQILKQLQETYVYNDQIEGEVV